MADGQRDQNQVVVAMGSYNGTPIPLKIDDTTGYLKAIIYNQILAAPTINASVAGHDQNSVHSALGSYEGTPKTLKVTDADGYLRAVNN